MLDQQIYEQRIRKLIQEVTRQRYGQYEPLSASYIYDQNSPIPYTRALKQKYKPIAIGTQWGKLWGSGWFTFEGTIPVSYKGKKAVALIDVGGEGCVFRDGEPMIGLTNKRARNMLTDKQIVPLADKAQGGESVSLLVEVAANELFGSQGEQQFILNSAHLACLNEDNWQLEMDLQILRSLMRACEEKSPRRNRLLRGLNEIANVWNEGKGVIACLEISRDLLSPKANASSNTVYSIGHAHLDLGWLWPVRETRRKGGRTFATALQMIEEYPDYKFGASQPQLYEWIKKDFPALFKRVKNAVAEKRWECQGAMWVEPDMNVTGGESLVRQCLYGKRFYKTEFGVNVRNLWLPDVFGYSASLPQILKKCGVDFFMTTKISWNETNTFPHHTFMWEGIDGTRILTHFLPTNDYNGSNLPHHLSDAEKRYAQNDISSEFMNLFGVGDGGGGPGRIHIEYGIRQKNVEGSPKFRFAFADQFFKKIDRIPKSMLPLWVGELYLELHRGTYTTQARMKRYNRLLELRLRDVEFLSSLTAFWPKVDLDRIWKNMLLNQFHDILPGSSIDLVYRDAHRDSERHLNTLNGLQDAALKALHGQAASSCTYLIYNTLSWDRICQVNLPAQKNLTSVENHQGHSLPVVRNGEYLTCRLQVPAMGYTTVILKETPPVSGKKLKASVSFLENDVIRVRMDTRGRIVSIFDKEENREALSGPANELMLWEDKPSNWDAWDINHYYRETLPAAPRRVSVRVDACSALEASIIQSFSIGNSSIEQRMSIEAGSKLVRIDNRVNWNEDHKMLRVSAQPAVYANQASFEIQYGTIKRPNHENTSWDRAKFEVPGHRFADLSQEDYGFAVINDCKYGHYVQGNTMDLTLLRSPKAPDRKADIDEHKFIFGYLPHRGRLETSNVLRIAHELNTPVIPWPVKDVPAEPVKSWYRLSDTTIKIEAVKRAENGKGIIIRLYETRGSGAAVRLEAADGWKSLFTATMLEKRENKIAGKGNVVDLRFQPFEIKTLLLTGHGL